MTERASETVARVLGPEWVPLMEANYTPIPGTANGLIQGPLDRKLLIRDQSIYLESEKARGVFRHEPPVKDLNDLLDRLYGPADEFVA